MGSLTCHLDHFDVELNEDWRWLSHNVGRKTSATFSGMLPAQDYQIRVRAITVAGAARYSDILHIQTKGEGNTNHLDPCGIAKVSILFLFPQST